MTENPTLAWRERRVVGRCIYFAHNSAQGFDIVELTLEAEKGRQNDFERETNLIFEFSIVSSQFCLVQRDCIYASDSSIVIFNTFINYVAIRDFGRCVYFS